MATFDQPSDLALPIPDRAFQRLELGTDSRVEIFPAKEEKRLPVSSSLQGTKRNGSIFNDSLIESGEKRGLRNPWAAMGSLAFQVFLLLAVVIIPLFHTDPLPKREMLTLLYPQPLASPGLSAPSLRAHRSTFPTTYITLPPPVRKTQETTTTPSPVNPIGGALGGTPGGVLGGLPIGALSEVLGSTHSVPVLAKTSDSTPTKRIRVPARTAEANLVYDVAPTYPPEAGRARIEGTVVLLAVIGKDGRVQNVTVESGIPLLANAAMDAVKQWRYRPYLLNGEPVEVASRITINFTLS
jgi:periplasmic protein TonB